MALPPVFIEFLGSYAGVKAAATGAKSEIASVEAEGGASASKFAAISKVALAAFGAAAAGAAYESLKLAVSFQSAMAQISTQAGVPKAQLASLGNGVLQLAGQVGFSPDSLAQALYHVESSFASVGISGPKALSLLKIAAEGAAVGHADLVDVTNALDAAVVSGIPGVQDYNQAMGILNATVGAGDMSMQDLSDAFSTGLLATVKGFGLSIKDVGAGLAVFGDNNIRGSQAATELRMAVESMAKPAATSGDELKKLGLSSTTLAKDMQTGGLLKALEDLKGHMDAAGVSASQQGQVITDLFGKKSGTGLNILIDQLDRVKSKYPDLTKGANGFATAVAQNNDTIQQKMNDAKAAFDALGVKIGTALLPAATRALGALSGLVGYMSVHTGVFYAVAAGIGAVGIAFAVASIASWSFTDSILADPIFWIVLAIAALVAGLVELIIHWKTVASWLDTAWHATVGALVTAWHWVAHETSAAWDAVSSAVAAGWHAVASFFSRAWQDIVNPVVSAWNWVKRTAVDGWNDVASFFVSAWHTVTDPIVKAWDTVVGITTTVWDGISRFFKKWWPLLLVIFAPVIAVVMSLWNHFHQDVFNTAVRIWNGVLSTLHSVWNRIQSAAGAAWHGIYRYIVAPAEDAARFVVAVMHTAYTGMVAAWHAIESTAATAWGFVRHCIVDPIDDAWHWLQGTWNTVVGWLSSKWRTIWSDATSLWNSVKGAITTPIQSAFNWLKNTFNNVKSVISSGINAAMSWLDGRWNAWVDIGKNIVLGIVHGVENAGSGLLSTVKNLANSALSAAKSFLGIHSPSRVAADEVGQWFTKGIAQGVTQHAPALYSAVRSVASGMVGGFRGMRAPSLSLGTSGAAGGTTVQNVVQVEVKGSVRSDRDLRDVVQQEMLRLGGRNPQTWAPARI